MRKSNNFDKKEYFFYRLLTDYNLIVKKSVNS